MQCSSIAVSGKEYCRNFSEAIWELALLPLILIWFENHFYDK